MSFASRVINFNRELVYTGQPLPAGIRIMNPFRESAGVMNIVQDFYKKFYDDHHKRLGVLGINPGRFGGAVTGIPFTDPKRLVNNCGISYNGPVTHEPSSVFVYEVIEAYGGPEKFYSRFYINSICPLGFTNTNKSGKEINYNYYDSPALEASVKDFIIANLKQQIGLGLYSGCCMVLGTGKNEKYLQKLNEEHLFFRKIFAVEHPRYVVQYKSASKTFYIDKYLRAFEMMEESLL